MANPDKVLNCCRYHWERPRDIAKRYDEIYPPKFYEFFRRWCMAGIPDSPSVMLYFELDYLRERGFLEFKVDGVDVFVASDGTKIVNRKIYYKLKPDGRMIRKEISTPSPTLQPA